MIIETRNSVDGSIREMETLIEFDDDPNGYSLRYMWIRHREFNEEFLNGYFSGGNAQGLNVRKSTTHLSKYWKDHNHAMDISGKTGDLVWRYKVMNPMSNSIDYIEVWRSSDILESIIHQNSDDTASNLARGIWESGFDVRTMPWRKISPKLALESYRELYLQFRSGDNCILNTKWNEKLNPYPI